MSTTVPGARRRLAVSRGGYMSNAIHIQAMRIIESDENDLRFENFSAAVVSKLTGCRVLTTSRTYDLARDGITLDALDGETVVVATSVAEKWERKAYADANELKGQAIAGRIFFSLNANISEEKRANLEAGLSQILKPARVGVLTCRSLADVVTQVPELLSLHYGSDLEALREWVSATEAMPEAQVAGLRVALATQFGDLGEALRTEVLDALVLADLVSSTAAGPATVANRISASLKLAGSLPPDAVAASLHRLESCGMTTQNGATSSVTDAGRTFQRDSVRGAREKLSAERNRCIDAIESTLGHKLSEQQADRTWSALTSSMSEAFEALGERVVEAISAIATGYSGQLDEDRQGVIDRIARRVAAEFSNPQQREEVATAMAGLLIDQSSPVADWAQRVACSFLAMCSLGLSDDSRRQLKLAISRLIVIPDTDVVLSLLCHSEPNHESLERVFRTWLALGGRVIVPRPVLEEAARHAWIALDDYREVAHLLPTLQANDLQLFVQNAFVRSYWDEYRPWSYHGFLSYLDDYRGRSVYDFSRIAAVLGQDFGFTIASTSEVPERAWCDDTEGRMLSRDLERLTAAFESKAIDDLDDKTLDKLHRDVRLLLTVARYAERNPQLGETYLILTSSYRLVRTGGRFALSRSGLAVLRPASLGAVVGLVPGVSMRASTIRALVSDSAIISRLQPVERAAIRALSALGPLRVPRARLATYRRKLNEAILDYARRAGKSRKAVETSIVDGTNQEAAASVIAEAVRGAAFGAELHGTVEELIEENTRLRSDIAALRSRTKSGDSDA